eukprot:1811771-Prymnesium_polylepis.1
MPMPGSIRHFLLYPPFTGSTRDGRVDPATTHGGPRDRPDWRARVVIAGRCDPSTIKFVRTVPEHTARCNEAADRTAHAAGYLELLNTTFALVPEGRQAASYRLDEVMAAGAIPVFMSDPFVPPFSQVVDWNAIAIFISREDAVAERTLEILGRLTAAQIVRMQRG